MFYVAHVHDSDSNDCTIFKLIVEAETLEQAYEKACTAVEERLAENKIEWETDGMYGGYYLCTCNVPEDEQDTWECCHGGWYVDIQESDMFATEEQAIDEATAEYYDPMFPS